MNNAIRTKFFVILIFNLFISSCGALSRITKPREAEIVVAPKLYDGKRTFKDCAEINTYLRTYNETCGLVDRPCSLTEAQSFNAFDMTLDKSNSVYQRTQERNIEESDIVKVSENFIFVSRLKSIAVIDREENTEIGRIMLTGQSQVELYIHGEKLVLIEEVNGTTQIRSYVLRGKEMPQLDSIKSIAGRLMETRVQRNELLVITSQHLSSPVPESEGAIDGIRCAEIVVPYIKNSDKQTGFLPANPNSLLKVSSLDLDNRLQTRSVMALLDQFRHIYVSESNVIVAKDLFEKDESTKTETTICTTTTGGCSCSNGTRYFDATYLAVLRRNQHNGEFSFKSAGEVLGRVPNKWAFKQFQNKNEFFLGTTIHENGGPEGSKMTSQVYRLDMEGQNVTIKGQVNDLAPDEEIRAMQYVDGFAYVVTSKKTDPLYILDLKGADAPKKMGELVVPGFSSMLYSLNTDALLGVGFDTVSAVSQGEYSEVSGIQFSLFDVSDRMSPKLRSVKVHGQFGSSSESTDDYHALFHDIETSMFASSLVEFESILDGAPLDPKNFKFSGSVFYSYQKNDLGEVARVTHEDLMPTACREARSRLFTKWWRTKNESFDVRRILKIDNKIFTVSPFGIKIHNDDFLGDVSVLRFANAEATCADILQRYGDQTRRP